MSGVVGELLVALGRALASSAPPLSLCKRIGHIPLYCGRVAPQRNASSVNEPVDHFTLTCTCCVQVQILTLCCSAKLL